MEEEWRCVPDFEGRYEVSSLGRVRSIRAPGSHARGAILKGTVNPRTGYRHVTLQAGPRRRCCNVHSLVAWAFLGPQPPGSEVRHLDGVKLNCASVNLSYGTQSENTLDRVRHGTHHEARKTHCKRNHPFDGTNTYINPCTGGRQCKTCTRDRNREYARARRRA